jgi:hypothetical protein
LFKILFRNSLQRAVIWTTYAAIAPGSPGYWAMGALRSALRGQPERYLASGAQSGRPHAELAIEHGIAVHRASLEWDRSALQALSGPKYHPNISET